MPLELDFSHFKPPSWPLNKCLHETSISQCKSQTFKVFSAMWRIWGNRAGELKLWPWQKLKSLVFWSCTVYVLLMLADVSQLRVVGAWQTMWIWWSDRLFHFVFRAPLVPPPSSLATPRFFLVYLSGWILFIAVKKLAKSSNAQPRKMRLPSRYVLRKSGASLRVKSSSLNAFTRITETIAEASFLKYRSNNQYKAVQQW